MMTAVTSAISPPTAPAGAEPAPPPGGLARIVAQLAMPAWALASLALADETGLLDCLLEPRTPEEAAPRSGLSVPQANAVLDVLAAVGLARRDGAAFVATSVLEPALSEPGRRILRAELRSNLLQIEHLIASARAGTVPARWDHRDALVLNAQGMRSIQLVDLWAAQLFPRMPGLVERLEAADGAWLDVGVGVAALTIAMGRRFPLLRAVGIDPHAPALAEARRNIEEARIGGRIELREGRVDDFKAQSSSDLVHIPAMFLSEAALEAGLPRALVALRPGGWVLVQVLAQSGTELMPAILRLWCTLWGNEALLPDHVAGMLRSVGFDAAQVFAPVPGGPPVAFVVGRSAS